MKKISLLLMLAFTLALTVPAHAQSFGWGVTGGLNMTKLKLSSDLKDNFKSDNQAGWYVGLKAQATILMGIGFDASLLYSQSKLYLSNKDTDLGDYETSRSIAIPVNLRYNMGLGRLASIFIATGPQFDFNIGNKSFGNILGSTVGLQNGPNAFKRENMTTSWNVGAGAKLLGHLELNVTYNFAISNLGKNALDLTGVNVPIGEGELKSNTFKVGATYYF